MKKKMVSMLVAASLSILSLAGCGKEVNETRKTQEASSKAEQTQDVSSSAPEAEDEKNRWKSLHFRWWTSRPRLPLVLSR